MNSRSSVPQRHHRRPRASWIGPTALAAISVVWASALVAYLAGLLGLQ
jgi:hypothetical protein